MYVTGYDISTIGGGQKSIKTCIQVTIDFGYEVSLVSPEIADKKNLPNANYYEYKRYKSRIKNYVLNAYSIYKYIKIVNPDIINCQYIGSILIVGILKKMKLIDNKVIYTDRGYLKGYTKVIHAFIKLISNTIDLLICTTKANQIEWMKYFPKLSSYVIENIIEDEWNNCNDINHTKLTIGFSGRFVSYKRWDDVFEIIRKLKDYEINWHIALAWNKEQENNVIKYKKSFDDTNTVFFDNLSTVEMKQFYEDLDIFILTSEKESFGRTLIEAMSQKCTVIGTNSGGVPSIIHKNLYEVGNIDACVDIILKYYNNENILDNDKLFFYLEYKKRFTKEIFSDKLHQCYLEI